jgi:hypothetical protein
MEIPGVFCGDFSQKKPQIFAGIFLQIFVQF